MLTHYFANYLYGFNRLKIVLTASNFVRFVAVEFLNLRYWLVIKHSANIVTIAAKVVPGLCDSVVLTLSLFIRCRFSSIRPNYLCHKLLRFFFGV